MRLGGGQVVLAGEQERDVDRHPGEDRLLNRDQPGTSARDLDEEIRAASLRMESPRLRNRAGRVVGEKWRDLERDPAVDALRRVVSRSEQVGRARQILNGQIE